MQAVKSVWCGNAFMLFTASLHKLCDDKQWIICSAADLIIHSDDLIISIRQIRVSQNGLHDQIRITTKLVYKDRESHHYIAVYHLSISLQLLSVFAHLPSYMNGLLVELAVYLTLISLKSFLLTFLALSLFGHWVCWKEDQSAELQSGEIRSSSFCHTGLRSVVKVK